MKTKGYILKTKGYILKDIHIIWRGFIIPISFELYSKRGIYL